VRLYLPRDRRAAAATAMEEPLVDRTLGGSETILVVEDNEPLRRTAAAKIAKLGYRVVEASNAAAALELLDGGLSPHLLFSDVVMPGKLDGVGLAQEAVRRLPNLKVVLTSGFTERGTALAEERVLPWPLISKPYRIADLALVLRDTLGRDAEMKRSGTA
jgi:DNA-binding NtrC family response regulator